MKKAIVTIILATMTTVSAVVPTMASEIAQPHDLAHYLSSVEDLGSVKFYDTEDLTEEIFEQCEENGEIVVEKINGYCINDAGDGYVLYDNGTELSGDYISYSSAIDSTTSKGIKPNQYVTTYIVYDGDYDYRFDVVNR